MLYFYIAPTLQRELNCKKLLFIPHIKIQFFAIVHTKESAQITQHSRQHKTHASLTRTFRPMLIRRLSNFHETPTFTPTPNAERPCVVAFNCFCYF